MSGVTCDVRTVLTVRVVPKALSPDAVRCPQCEKLLVAGQPGGHFTVTCKRCSSIVEVRERIG